MVTNCILVGPLKSSFKQRSNIHTTTQTTKKYIHVTNHIIGVNGLKKAQALDFIFLIGVTTTSLDSMYGCVKSTILVQFVVIVMSLTIGSNSYI